MWRYLCLFATIFVTGLRVPPHRAFLHQIVICVAVLLYCSLVSFAGVNRAERTENMKNSTFAVSGVVEAGTFGAIVINGGIGLVAPYEDYDGFEDCVESAIEEAVTYSAEVLNTIR